MPSKGRRQAGKNSGARASPAQGLAALLFECVAFALEAAEGFHRFAALLLLTQAPAHSGEQIVISGRRRINRDGAMERVEGCVQLAAKLVRLGHLKPATIRSRVDLHCLAREL